MHNLALNPAHGVFYSLRNIVDKPIVPDIPSGSCKRSLLC